ncbi:MAG TPA: regulatory protein RecX, partial [Dehalococcoidia bacterium]|nr:regulatory protein RecX [Dehalococcoidia bacterium]
MAPRHGIEQAMERSYRLLQHRMRSTAEIRRSLQAAGFPTRVVEEAISRLLQQGLLDDDAFARSWSESRQAFRPRSRRLIRKELRDKGIAPELADRLTEGIDDDVVALE